MSNLEDDPTIISALRDFRARVTLRYCHRRLWSSEVDAKRIDRTGYEVLKTERDVLIGELRGLGVNIMDWGRYATIDCTGARGF